MTSSGVDAKLHKVIAWHEIYNTVCNYMRGQDRLLPEVQRAAFHDDAVVDCGLFCGGPDAYVDFAQGFLQSHESNQHLIGQVHIDVEGDVAFGEVYFIAYHRWKENGEDKDLFIGGRYIDRYECRDGVWKIARRRELVDWARSDAPTDHFLREAEGLHLGKRGAEDFSSQREALRKL